MRCRKFNALLEAPQVPRCRQQAVGREKIGQTRARTRDSLNLVRVRYRYASQPVAGGIINSNKSNAAVHTYGMWSTDGVRLFSARAVLLVPREAERRISLLNVAWTPPAVRGMQPRIYKR
jgi:hypothetical protein